MFEWIKKFKKKKCEHPWRYRNFICEFDDNTVGYYCRSCRKKFTIKKVLIMDKDGEDD